MSHAKLLKCSVLTIQNRGGQETRKWGKFTLPTTKFSGLPKGCFKSRSKEDRTNLKHKRAKKVLKYLKGQLCNTQRPGELIGKTGLTFIMNFGSSRKRKKKLVGLGRTTGRPRSCFPRLGK